MNTQTETTKSRKTVRRAKSLKAKSKAGAQKTATKKATVKKSAVRHEVAPIDLTEADSSFLNEAALFLVNPGLVAKGLSWVSRPVELAQDRLPQKVRDVIAATSEKAIQKALSAALSSLPKDESKGDFEIFSAKASRKSSLFHRGVTSLAGAATGLVGLPLLPIELPFTTVVILRGILDQARLYGHDLNDTETRLEALMVFSLSPDGENEDSGSLSYFATRAAYSRLAQKALSYTAAMSAREVMLSLDRGAAPILFKLVSSVAEKFQMRVTQKVIAESIPLAGALGGGALNYAFTDFFVTSAKYHFGVRALEQKYGLTRIQNMLKEKMQLAQMV